MNEILSSVLALLPPKRKTTPSGWTSFNAVCCHHNGENPDTRQRGGIMTNSQGGFNYHCFNCGFKTGWTPGILLGENTRNLFKWLGMDNSEIGRLNILALKLRDSEFPEHKELRFDLEPRELPELSLPISEWLDLDLPNDIQQDLAQVLDYIVNERKMNLTWYPWHWSPADGYKDRVIIPFFHQGKIVGSTARKIIDGKPKYITDSQNGYVFNLDSQNKDRKYVILAEGQFDAIAVDGIAIGHNQPNKTQAMRINSLNRQVIVVPDRDRPGAKLIDAALEYGWSVSLPPWNETVKDLADAVKQFGRLYTLMSVLHYKETNTVKIQLLKKRLESQ